MNTVLQKKIENTGLELSIPPNKENLTNALITIKEGINKANKAKQVDLQTAVVLRDTIINLNDIIANVIRACYKDDKPTNVPLTKINIPDRLRLESMLKVIYHTIEKAQINGTYDTIDESGSLYDSLSIIGNLLGSMIYYIDSKEKEKLIKTSEMKEQQDFENDNSKVKFGTI